MAPRRVLVVDDSAFFRKRLAEILDDGTELEVVGMAGDGREAVEQVVRLQPDVVTMDVEMPVMDGITAVRRIMQQRPTPVLMVSSLTREGARATFEALEAGAVDFLPKNIEAFARDRDEAGRRLREKVIQIARHGARRPHPGATTPRRADEEPVGASPPTRVRLSPRQYRVLAIGCSTGGPVALQQVLSGLPGRFPVPILIVQHMPAAFTPDFAERLDRLGSVRVTEARNGDRLEAGHAYLAPGGRQMLVESRGAGLELRVIEGDPSLIYRPSVDVTFASLARAGVGEVLALVMTGMGADGREGARLLKEKGATVWAQDEATSTIFGMPGAIVRAGLADQVLPLPEIAPALRQAIR